MQSEYDCVVIGGGPGGSTVAALVAEDGHRVLLLERERMPRFRVGESLMPDSYWILKRLGVLHRMKSGRYVPKLSVQFVSHTGVESQPFFFRQHDPRDCARTWQVERSSFDQMLFDNARDKGADVFDQTRVLSVCFDGERAAGVKVKCADGTQREVRSKVVVDASGQQAMIANAKQLRMDDPDLCKIAVWSYFKNAKRDDGENGGATIIFNTEGKKSWFWFIPLSNNVTSVGVVGDRAYMLNRRGDSEDIFREELAKCPAMAERLRESMRTEDLRVIKEFSYTTRQQAGDGWVMVGDAFGFIDPIYSSGVFFALKSGEMAADAIAAALVEKDTSAGKLGSWVAEFAEGSQWVRKLVQAFYTEEFSIGRFLKKHPEHQSNLVDVLIGRIFYPGAGRMFDDVQKAIDEAKQAM